MHPKKIWANLGIANIDRTRKFYSALGFTLNEQKPSDQLTSFSFGTEHFIINFFLDKILEKNIKGILTDTTKTNEVVFTISAANRQEVDEWENEVKNSEGQLISGAEEFGEGYYGFLFADPDGHRFNVFYMKGM